MPAIRFPVSAVPLLPLCKGHGHEFVFKTYADLVGFAASYGFHLVRLGGRLLPSNPRFVDTPNAINMEVFDNRGIYGNLLMMALAQNESRKIAEDEELLAKLMEQHASLGAEAMTLKLDGKAYSEQVAVLASLLEFKSEEQLQI